MKLSRVRKRIRLPVSLKKRVFFMMALATLGLFVRTLTRQGHRKQPACQRWRSIEAQAFPTHGAGSTSQNDAREGVAKGRVLSAVNMTRRTRASMSRTCMLAWIASGGPALAQPAGASPQPGSQPAAEGPNGQVRAATLWTTQPPPPHECMRAYETLRTWLDAKGREPLGDLPSCEAASITLRRFGRVLGRGVAIAEHAGDTSVTIRAFQAAWEQVPAALARMRQQAEDAIAIESLEDLAPRLDMSLELSGAWQPVAIKSFKDLEGKVVLGKQGLGVRLGASAAAAFPEQQFVTGNSLTVTMGGLVARATGDPALGVEPVDVLIRERDAKFYVFEVAHLAPGWPEDSPQFLSRCSRLAARPNAADLVTMGDSLAQHLIRSSVRASLADEGAPVGEVGVEGRAADSLAGDMESSASKVIALRRYARMPGAHAETAAGAHQCADRLLRTAADWWRDKHGVSDQRVNLAWWIIAASDAIGPNPPRSLAEVSNGDSRALIELLAPKLLESAKGGDVPIADRGVVALAWVRLSQLGLATLPQARDAVKGAYQDVPRERLIELMPWLCWAELELQPQGALETSVGLRELRRSVWARQWTYDDLPEAERDAVGLFSPSAPRPTVTNGRSLAPHDVVDFETTGHWLAFTGAMLGDARLTPAGELPGELARQLDGLRAVRQAQVHGAMVRWSDRPLDKQGGIVTWLWDYKTASATTSAALISISETTRSLQR